MKNYLIPHRWNVIGGLIGVLFILLSGSALALNESPQTFTLDGKLYRTGTTTVLAESGIRLKIQILNPNKNCVLYEEEQTVNTSSTQGYFNIQVGSSVGSSKRTSNDPGSTMNQVFQNLTVITGTDVPSQTCTGSSYTPAAGDVRYFRITVTPSSTNVADILSPDMLLNSVPQAIVAQSLQGLEKSNVLQVKNSGSTVLTQANLEAAFTTPAYTNLQSILAGNFLKTDTTGANLPSFASNPSGLAAGDLWYDSTSNSVKFYNGSTVQTIGTSGSGIASLTVGSSMSADGSVGGSLTSSGTIDLSNTGVAAGTYPKVTVDIKGRVSAGASLDQTDIPTLTTAGKVSGDAIITGSISGDTSINTTGNLVSSGTVSGQTVQATQLRIYNGANYVQFTSPALSGNVLFTLPDNDGGNGDILQSNGSGGLSWVSPTAGFGSQTARTVLAAPQGANGAPTFRLLNITDIRSTAVGNGAFLTGAACGAGAALTYDSVSDTITCTVIVPTVTNASTLAQGKIWVGDGSNKAQAVTISGDASISTDGTLALKNVGTAGTYTKVTTDAQGRVTSGTNLVSADVTTALGYTPVNKAGDTMAGALNMGGYDITNVGNIELAASKHLLLSQHAADPSTAGWGAAEKGRTWYNTTSNSIKYWNGSAVQALGLASSGLTSLGGQTGQTQTLAISVDNSVATPTITSGSDAHTWKIPMALTTGVTAGLISKTEYDTFNAKLGTTTAFSGDVTGTYDNTSVDKIKGKALSPAAYASGQVLRYNGTNWVNTTLDFSDLSNKPTTLAGYGITDAMSSSLASGKILVGNASGDATAVTVSGDATINNAGILALDTTGVSAGTYTKVTVDTKGRVTVGGNIISGDVTTALGYVPLNKAGDSMTGVFGLYQTSSDPSTAGWGASEKGRAWFNTTSNQVKYWDGSAVQALGVASAGLTSLGGQTGQTQTFAYSIDNSVVQPQITSATDVHTLKYPMASNTGTTAGLISKAEYDTFNNKLGTTTNFSGDVTGTYDNNSVDKIKGKAVTAASATNQLMIYDGTAWVNSIVSGDATITSAGTLTLDTTGVSAGTYSKVQVDAKGRVLVGSQITSADVTTALGYTPTTAALNDGQIFVGNVSNVASPVTLSGDATLSNAGILSLISTGVSTGTFGSATAVPSFTVDAKGRITVAGSQAYADATAVSKGIVQTGANITNSSGVISVTSTDVTNALGFTPLNKAGDSMLGTLGLYQTSSDPSTAGWNGTQKGFTWFNTTSNEVKYWDGSAVKVLGVAGSGVQSINGQSGNAQTIAVSTDNSVVLPTITAGSDTITLKIPFASNTGTTAGLLSKADYDSFNAKLGTASAFSGDVSGTYNATSVDMIKGKAVSAASATNQIMIYDGSAWVNSTVSGDATITSAGTLTLDTTGVSAGTYTKVQVDAKGRVLAASQINSTDVTTALGYTPTTAALNDGQIFVGNASNVATAVIMSGDATLSNAGLLSLISTGVSTGTFGSATAVPSFTVDSKGRITVAGSQAYADATAVSKGIVQTGANITNSSGVISVTSTDVTNALGYTPVNKAGDTMAGAINMGGYDITNVGNIELAASKHLLLSQHGSDPSTAGWGNAEKGRTWFNTTANAIKYWNGSAVQTLGVASSGLTSLGGQTGQTQTLAISVDNSVATPTITSGSDAHTWKIPMALTTGVTAGLISKAEYDTFNAKLGTTTAFSGDVTGTYDNTSVDKIKGKALSPAAYASGQVLRYDGTNWVNTALDFADLANKPTTLAGYGITDAMSSSLASGKILVGNASGDATAVTVSGDATINNAGILSLDTTGVAAGTYSKLTVDTKGRVTVGANLVSGDITTALGFTPLNKAGDSMLGTLGLYQTSSDPSTAGWNGTQKGFTWFNTTSNEVKYWDGSAIKVLGVAGSGVQSINGQSGNAQTIAVSTDNSVTLPTIAAGSDTITLKIPFASNAGTTAGLISKAEYDTFNAKLGTATSFSGDVSGTYNATSVDMIKGKAVSAASATNQIMIYDGSAWVNSIVSGDATITSAGTLTLDTTGVSAGTYTKVQVDAKGRVLSASQITSTDVTTALGYTPTTAALNDGQIFVGNVSNVSTAVTMSGDATLNNAGLLSLVSTGVSTGTFGSATAVPSFTVDSKGRITVAGSQAYADATAVSKGIVQTGANITNSSGVISVTSTDVTNALGYTPVNKAGDTMAGALNMGGYNITNIGNIELAASKHLLLSQHGSDPDTTGWGNAEKGRTWFNTTANAIKYWNGSAVQTLGVASSGLTSLGGQTGQTQTFAYSIDNSVVQPQITSASDIHTLKYPMASNTGTTAGLISKTEYDTFNSKLGTSTAFSGDVTGTYNATSVDKIKGKALSPAAYASGQVLRYDGTNWVNTALDFADLANKPTTLAGYGITDAMSSSLASGKILVGNASGDATAVTVSGDATINNAGILALDTTGVAAGTYSKLTVDTKGRVTVGANLVSGDITTALGFTPLNKAGDSMLGTLGLYQTSSDPSTAGWNGTQKGFTWFNTTSNEVKYWDGSAIKVLGVAGSGVQSINGQTGTAQTIAVSTDNSVTLPTIAAGSDTITLKIPFASNTGTTAGLLSKADYDVFNAKLGTATAFSGDVTGTYNNNSVDKIKGKAVTAASATNQLMIYDGTSWVNSIVSGDATITSAGTLTLDTTGVSAGTYTKVQVDAKGRVLSASQINSADVTTALGYTPANGSLNDGQIFIGNASNAATAVVMSGDATLSNAGLLSLISTGVSTGTYGSATAVPSFTVDAKGRITVAGSQAYADATAVSKGIVQVGSNITVSSGTISVTSTDVTNALGYTPVNKAGDTMAGALNMGGYDITNVGNIELAASKHLLLSQHGSDPSTAGWGNAEKGRTWFNTTANAIKYWNGSAVQTLGVASSGLTSLGGQTGQTQTLAFSVDNSVTTPTITSGSDAHTWKIPMASNTGTTAGLLNKTDYDTFTAKLGTSTAFSGDVTGTYNATSVDKIKGKALSPAAYASGQVLRYDGTNWVNTTLDFADLSNKPTTIAGYGITDAMSNSLASGKIWVGSASGDATAVTMSGDATISNAGILTLNTVPVSKGGTSSTSFTANSLVVANGTGNALISLTCGLNQLVSFDASGIAGCYNAGSVLNGTFFTQGGNAYSADATLGTTDNFPLLVKTNNTTRMAISQDGTVAITNRLTLNGGLLLNQGTGATDNLIYLRSSSSGAVDASMGFFAAGLGSGSEAHGPYFLARGNSYSASANQRGNMFFSAGQPTSPNSAEGALVFQTNALERMKVYQDGKFAFGGYAPEYAYDFINPSGESGRFATSASGAEAIPLRIDNNGAAATGSITTLRFQASSTNSSRLPTSTISSVVTNHTHPTFNADLYFATTLNNVGNERMRIMSSGNVGIGTSAPGTSLDVSGAITSRPYGTSTGNTGQILLRELATNGTNTVSLRAPDNIASDVSFTIPSADGSSGQVLTTNASGGLYWSTAATSATAFVNGGNSFGGATTLGTNDNNALNFETNNVTRMKIATSGNVGIGNTSPGYSLDVTGSVNFDDGSSNGVRFGGGNGRFEVWSQGSWPAGYYTTVSNSTNTVDTALVVSTQASGGTPATGSGSGLRFDGYMNSAYRDMAQISSIWTNATFATRSAGLQFSTVDNGGSLTERMRISSLGYVGIGNSSPGTSLDVSGAITSRPYGTSSGNTGQILMRELAANGTNTVTLRAPDALAADVSFTMPSADGSSGQVLSTTGSGVWKWIDVSASGTTSADWTTSGASDLYRASGKVAIGGAIPNNSGVLNVYADTTASTDTSYAIAAVSGADNMYRLQLGYDYLSDAGIIQSLKTGVSYKPTVINGRGGNVGIGVLNPAASLDVSGAIRTGPTGTASGSTGRVLFRELNANGVNTVTLRAPDAIASDVSFTIPSADGSSGQVLTTNASGGLYWSTAATSATAFINGGNAFGANASLGTTDSRPLAFLTNNSTRMVISQDGSVGIGTTSPDAKLDVVGNSEFSGHIYQNGGSIMLSDSTAVIKSNSGSAGSNLSVIGGGSTSSSLTLQSTESAGGTDYINFKVGNNGSKESMRIINSGNVGIGTTAPGTSLDVSGAITIRPTGTSTGNTGQILMRELAANGTNTITLKAPDALSADVSFALPSGDGTAGQVLTTNGSGALSFGNVATANLPTAAKVQVCEIVIGDPGSASTALANDNDTPVVCANKTGATMTITAVECYADAGSPTVTPIITGGAATSILTGALTCGTASFASGTLNGTPTQSNNGTIDANITAAGGTAKYIVIRITRTL